MVDRMKDFGGLEKWAQHVIQTLSVAAIIWFGMTLSELKTQNAITQIKVVSIQERLSDMSLNVRDRYTKTEALNDINRTVDTLKDHELRLRKLEAESLVIQRGTP